jgi:hypothetical protein
MSRRVKALPELKPIYVRPTFSRRERDDCRAWRDAAFSGERCRLKRGQFDPLQMRAGMRVWLIEQRAGWVVSSPLYDETLRRVPADDPSLPGRGWLLQLYRWQHHELVTLPGVRAVIHDRLTFGEAAQEFMGSPRPVAAVSAAAEPQMEMFA